MRFHVIACLCIILQFISISRTVAADSAAVSDTHFIDLSSSIYSEMGGNLYSWPLSLNYERLLCAGNSDAIICRAEVSGFLLLKMINAGVIVGYSLGRQNAWEFNIGLSNELFARIPDMYSNYKIGYKLSNGIYYRHYGKNQSLFRVGIGTIYFLTNQLTDQSNLIPLFGISYGFCWN